MPRSNASRRCSSRLIILVMGIIVGALILSMLLAITSINEVAV